MTGHVDFGDKSLLQRTTGGLSSLSDHDGWQRSDEAPVHSAGQQGSAAASRPLSLCALALQAGCILEKSSMRNEQLAEGTPEAEAEAGGTDVGRDVSELSAASLPVCPHPAIRWISLLSCIQQQEYSLLLRCICTKSVRFHVRSHKP